MFIRRVEIENFGPFEKTAYSVPDRGLVLVEGTNRDSADGGSNGSGKSMLIADALSWCLYGKTLRGASHDEVVRAGSTGGTMVKVSLNAFGKDLTITRHRKHSTGKNSCTILQNGKDITPAVKPDDLIVKLLGTPWSVWQYALCLGQGLAYRFMTLTDAQRVGLLEDLLSLSVYDKARSYARDKLGEVRLHLSVLAQDAKHSADMIEAGKFSLKSGEKVLAALRDQQAKAGGDPSVRDELQAKLAAADAAFTEASGRVQVALGEKFQAASSLQDAHRALLHAKSMLAGLHRKVEESVESEAAVAGGVCSLCRQSLSVARKADVGEKLAKQREAAQDEHARALADIARYEQKKQECSAGVARTTVAAKAASEIAEAAAQHAQALRAKLTAMPAPVPEASLKAAQEAVEAAQQQIDHASEALAVVNVEIERNKRSEKAWSFWADGFARIRQQAMERAVGFLSDRFTHYLGILFGSEVVAGIRLDDKRSSAGAATAVRVDVATPGGSYVTASGGERDRIDLALAFALHDLVTQSSGARANLMVADEIGGFVDEEGVARIVRLLQAKADTVGTVFVMTQNPVWRKHIDHVWRVTKEAGKSEVKTYKS